MKAMGGVLMGVGFLVVAGAAGSSDYESTMTTGTITPFWEIALMAGVGLLLMYVGSRILGAEKKEKNGRLYDYCDQARIRDMNNRE